MFDLVDIFDEMQRGTVLWVDIIDFFPEEIRLAEYEGKEAEAVSVSKEDYLASIGLGNTYVAPRLVKSI